MRDEETRKLHLGWRAYTFRQAALMCDPTVAMIDAATAIAPFTAALVALNLPAPSTPNPEPHGVKTRK